MANQISLMECLQHAPPNLTIRPHGNSKNNTNGEYQATDIQDVANWGGFTLARIMQRYGPLLNTASLIARDDMPQSPDRGVNSEGVVGNRVARFLQDRVRRSLRVTFRQLRATQQLGQKTPSSYDHGDMAQLIDNFKPDGAFFAVNAPPATIVPRNRAPGDIKPSWK